MEIYSSKQESRVGRRSEWPYSLENKLVNKWVRVERVEKRKKKRKRKKRKVNLDRERKKERPCSIET